MRLEGLGQLKQLNDLIDNRTRDLPACSIVPQPTTLPGAPPGIYRERTTETTRRISQGPRFEPGTSGIRSRSDHAVSLLPCYAVPSSNLDTDTAVLIDIFRYFPQFLHENAG
jgi:hypothetical protein